MKNLIILITFLCILSGCKDGFQSIFSKGDSTDISVIGDRTDPLKKEPSEEVLPFYKLDDDHIYDACRLRFRDVSDLEVTDIQSLNIAAAYPILSNSNERIAELKSFKTRVKEVFENAKKNYNKTQDFSYVFPSIISEANYLSHSTAKNKYLIIFSNMLDHNTDYLDFYNPLIVDMIVHHPEQVMQSLESRMKIESLKGIKVIIVYQGNEQNIREERLFLIAENFYAKLLTRHSAEVVCVPNLNLLTSN